MNKLELFAMIFRTDSVRVLSWLYSSSDDTSSGTALSVGITILNTFLRGLVISLLCVKQIA